MSGARLAVGDWCDFEDERHQVEGFVGSATRLRAASGGVQIIATAALLADSGFRVVGAAAGAAALAAGLDPGAVLDGVGDAERARVLAMQAHLREATTGYASGRAEDARPGEPLPAYRPELTLNQRLDAKAAELGLTGRRLWQLLDAWRGQGLWGLVDKRKTRPRQPLAGVDPRVLAAIREQYAAETYDSAAATGGRFRRRVQNASITTTARA